MVGEAVVMGILHAFDLRGAWDIVLDPILLALLCAPVMFLVILRPLARKLQKAQQAKRKQESSRKFLQTVLDAIPSGTLVLGRDYRILLANQAACESAFHPDPVAAGLTCHQLSHRSSAPCQGKNDPCPFRQAVATKEPATVTHRHYDAEGNEALIEITASPILDEAGEVTQIVECSTDITQRGRTEERNAHLGRILEDSLNEIYVLDAETLRFTLVNRGARENLGYTMDELQDLSPIDIVPDFTPDIFSQLVSPLLSGQQGTICFAVVHRRKDGSRYPVEVRLQLSDHEFSRVFVAIVSDITERREAEEHLAMTLQKLERFNRLAMGREIRMIELKREVNDMAHKAQRPAPYDLSFSEDHCQEASHA